MKTINKFKIYSLTALLFMGVTLTNCSDDDDAPAPENEVEVITDVKLIFTNDADDTDVVEARAQDPDGEGVEELEILDEINLDADKTYTLTLEVMNNLDPDDAEDIGEEIEEEADEHQLFFGFSNDAFASPAGNGNIDTAADAVNYLDEDGNGYSLGLITSWTTATTLNDGSFTVRLQHQPDLKTATSGATDGDTDFDLTFVLNIQ